MTIVEDSMAIAIQHNPVGAALREQAEILREATGHSDRRTDRRYPLRWQLEVLALGNDTLLVTCPGRTKNVSRTGVLFECDAAVSAGSIVRLRIEWPIQPGGRGCLLWIVHGIIVRTGRAGETAARIVRHEFVRVPDPAVGKERILAIARKRSAPDQQKFS